MIIKCFSIKLVFSNCYDQCMQHTSASAVIRIILLNVKQEVNTSLMGHYIIRDTKVYNVNQHQGNLNKSYVAKLILSHYIYIITYNMRTHKCVILVFYDSCT